MDREVYQRLDALQVEHWWFRSRREILSSVLGRLRFPAHPPQILEAGCGTGGNLAMLSKLGTVTAFEHDLVALQMARGKGEFSLKQGTLPAGSFDYKHPFDLVVAFDVIEHVNEDLESLKRLRSLLKADGIMVLTVPAFPFLWSHHDEIHHHCRRYTRAQLDTIMRKAGFEVEYLSYYNSLLFPFVAGVRIIKNLLGIRDNYDDSITPPGLNSALHKIFSAERYWIGKFSIPFGISLLAVARNPVST